MAVLRISIALLCLTVMGVLADPVIKTIKPDGSGDYTTLQSWEDWADDQTNGPQWAECYGTGDLGVVAVSSWTVSTGRIYAAAGHRHDGTKNGNHGARIYAPATQIGIDSTIDHIDIDGLAILSPTSLVNAAIQLQPASGFNEATVSNCLIVYRNDGDNQASGIWFATAVTSTSVLRIANNLIYPSNGGYGFSEGIYISLTGFDWSPVVDAYICNNTIVGQWDGMEWEVGSFAGLAELNMYLTNNVCLDSDSDDYAEDRGANSTGVTVMAYCASTDGSATNWGGAGNQTGVTVAASFISTNDYHLTSTSPLVNSGTDAEVERDAAGLLRGQYRLHDMGAFERKRRRRP